MKSNGRFSPLIVLAVSGVVAVAAFVGGQTIQRPKTFDPKVISPAKIGQPKPPNSMGNVHLPDPLPLEPDWQGKHEPLTLHVAESNVPGRGTAISVSQPDGSGFFRLRDQGVVQVYSPYYALKRIDRIQDIATYVFGNDTVECKVMVSPNGSLFKLTLTCQRSDPEISQNSVFEARPFYVLVSRKDPETGVVQRGEAMVTLNGFVVDKP